MKAFLDHFAAILGAATIALLLMSVTHEYGYFWIIGRHFQTFLTTSDYFSNAVLWLPFSLFLLYGYLDWDVMFGRRRYTPLGLNWGTVLWVLIWIGFPIAAFFYLPLNSASVLTYALPIVLFWLMYGTQLLPFADTDSDLLRHVRRLLVVAPVVMLMLFGWGVSHGLIDLRSFSEPYTLEMKEGGRLQRILLRTFDKGILVRNPVDSRIEFVKWDGIERINRFSAPPSDAPPSCSWFGINCPEATPSL
jgi:hypothetical protein